MACVRKRAVSLSCVEVSFSYGRPLTHPFGRTFPNQFSVLYLSDQSRLTKSIWRWCISRSAISFACMLGTAGHVFSSGSVNENQRPSNSYNGDLNGLLVPDPLGGGDGPALAKPVHRSISLGALQEKQVM